MRTTRAARESGRASSPSFRPVALLLVALAAPVGAADRALVIGIDDYSDSRVSLPDGTVGRIGDLRGANNDVRAVRTLLEDGFGMPSEAIRELTDRRATRRAVLDALDELVRETVPGDRVFLHFSGHGVQVRDEDGDERDDGLDEVLVTADADCLASASGATVERCEGVVLDDELGARLDRLDGRHVLVMIDSCHSGTSTRSLFGGTGNARLATFPRPPSRGASRSMPLTPDPVPAHASAAVRTRAARFVDPGPKRVSLFAVAPGQLALEVDDGRGRRVGLFSHHLVEGLLGGRADANGDAEVSFAELLSHMGKASRRHCLQASGAAACPAGGIDPRGELEPALLGTGVLSFGRAVASEVDDAVSETELTATLPPRNPANLRVRVGPRPDFRDGEPMTLEITADRTGLLMVFDRAADGELLRLYPSDDDVAETARPDGRPLGWVRAGSTVTMPDAYAGTQWPMGEPYGAGTIVAVLAEDVEAFAPALDRIAGATRAFTPTARPEAWLGELYAALETMIPTGDPETPLRASRWSMTSADYRVSP